MENNTHSIRIYTNLENSHRGAIPKLNKVIDAYLKVQKKHKPYIKGERSHYWGAEHFNLQKSSLFSQATPEQQRLILEGCSHNLIRESYFVEKSAFAYCGKMILLAESTEIAQVYSMIANEEAVHLEWITPYMDVEKRHQPEGEFFKFLSYLIESCDANLLTYLVQVILEGWGLHHYKNLAHGCLDERLKGVFLDILRDEALHHHTGEVIFAAHQASPSQQQFIEDCLKTYAEMVRVGPLELVSTVDQILGGISLSDRTKFLLEIEAYESTSKKLALLKKLMVQPGVEAIVQKLQDNNFFTPAMR